MYNICVLWHSKIVMFGLHNWVFLFFLICPCIICSKRKYAKKTSTYISIKPLNKKIAARVDRFCIKLNLFSDIVVSCLNLYSITFFPKFYSVVQKFNFTIICTVLNLPCSWKLILKYLLSSTQNAF